METITDPVKIKAAAAYNAAADHFDDEALSLWAKYGRRTVVRLALRSGATVLDVGCGTGASAIPAAVEVGPKGKVIAVDLAERRPVPVEWRVREAIAAFEPELEL